MGEKHIAGQNRTKKEISNHCRMTLHDPSSPSPSLPSPFSPTYSASHKIRTTTTLDFVSFMPLSSRSHRHSRPPSPQKWLFFLESKWGEREGTSLMENVALSHFHILGIQLFFSSSLFPFVYGRGEKGMLVDLWDKLNDNSIITRLCPPSDVSSHISF